MVKETRMQQNSIRRLPTRRNDLFAFEISGRIHETAIEGMARTLKSAFDTMGQVDILIVIMTWDGIDLGAVFDKESLGAQARANSHVRRYGIVGAPAWTAAMINLFSPLTPVEERTFSLAELGEAWSWMGEDRAVEDLGRPGSSTV